jgi:hypothetical protein
MQETILLTCLLLVRLGLSSGIAVFAALLRYQIVHSNPPMSTGSSGADYCRSFLLRGPWIVFPFVATLE